MPSGWRALDALVAQLAGYALGLAGATAAGALARQACPETAAAIRAELGCIAATPIRARRPPLPDVDHELDRHRRGLAVDDFHRLLRLRLVEARGEARAIVARLVAVALARAPHERIGFARALGATTPDDLMPDRFGAQVAVGWRATCEAIRAARAPIAPPAREPREPAAENYCWMRIR